MKNIEKGLYLEGVINNRRGNMIKELAILILGAALMWGCNSTKKIDEYCGVYEGTLPAADAPGIKATVSLDKAYHYTERMIFIDRENADFTEKGSYLVDGDMLMLEADGGEKTYYQIEEGQLRLLNQEKEPITGALADYYILKKVSGCK